MRTIHYGNSKCNVPNFIFLKMFNFDIYYMSYILLLQIFGWPKIWNITFGVAHCIALTDYSWLMLVINCNNEVCSASNNNVSRASPRQRISCCGVIYYTVIPLDKAWYWHCYQLGTESEWMCCALMGNTEYLNSSKVGWSSIAGVQVHCEAQLTCRLLS